MLILVFGQIPVTTRPVVVPTTPMGNTTILETLTVGSNSTNTTRT